MSLAGDREAAGPDADAANTNATAASLAPSQAAFLLSSFTNFLTVALHSILYHRKLYPAATFLTARAYNLPVLQSRHPGVCAWIRDAVAATAQQIRLGAARHICLVVHAPRSLDVVERWIFDVQSFPASWGADKDWPPQAGLDFDSSDHVNRDAAPGQDTVNPTDVHEALRGALSRFSHAGQSRPPLPDGCTFTLGVELRDQAVAPIRHPQVWIPSQPSLQAPAENRPELGRARGGISTTPIRSVQAGPLFFECWVEQGKGGLDAVADKASVTPTFSSTFQGSGSADVTTSSSLKS
ncbi:hypothetical protein EsDP_00000859 [Epichloe bromicola]|uniref:HORMA domain-containing protein n=1 Tax=Epichloe bromicola TaxID=79588 RepID=A0ABQ0CG54_9HYPO